MDADLMQFLRQIREKMTDIRHFEKEGMQKMTPGRGKASSGSPKTPENKKERAPKSRSTYSVYQIPISGVNGRQ